jgi:tetratricopeptide (TPR) repeat protein
MKNIDFARAVVDTAVAMNPGDPDLLRMRWAILYSAKDYKNMYVQGEELAKIDTSFTDSTYFARTATAYANDSMPQKSAETAARALAKYPTSAFFSGFEIQQLQKAGQQQQALDKLDKALASKIAVENAGTLRLLMLRDLKRSAEVIPAIRILIAAGDTSTYVRQILFAQAADDRTASLAAAKNQVDTLATERVALGILAYADSSITGRTPLKSESQFRLGAEHLQMVQPLVKLATAQKSCQMAKEAKEHISEAQILLPQGGASNPKLVPQLMGALAQLDPYTDQTIKAVCK